MCSPIYVYIYIYMKIPSQCQACCLQVIKVFDIRQWYTPCVYHEEQCHDEVGMAKRSGTLDLRRLAGYHRYQGTWKPCMGECQKPPENRTKGHQQPLQGLSRLTDL